MKRKHRGRCYEGGRYSGALLLGWLRNHLYVQNLQYQKARQLCIGDAPKLPHSGMFPYINGYFRGPSL